jgi:hypothetical protein
MPRFGATKPGPFEARYLEARYLEAKYLEAKYRGVTLR